MIDLGSLYTKIEADTSGLNKSYTSIKSFTTKSTKLFLGVGAAAAAAASAGVLASAKMVSSVAKQTKELSYLSQQAGTSVGDLQSIAYATETVGVNAEKLADISKDVFDKLGDYAAGKGGEFKDFFENIGDKAGLTAKELMKLSGPEALGAIKKALDDAGLSAKEQIFYMESIANDASRLIPLLAEDSKQLKEMAARGKELGVSLSNIQVSRLLEVSKVTKELSTAFSAMKNKIASDLAPIHTAISTYLIGAIEEFNTKVSSVDITKWAKETSIAMLEFSINSVKGFQDTYVFVNKIIGVLKLAYAGALTLGKGFQWLFEKANEMYGDTDKAKYWADAQIEATKMIEDTLASANDSFTKSDAGLGWTEKAVSKIKELQNQIEKIDENAIENNLTKPLEKVNKKPLATMYKNFEGIWVNGGKKAETNLGNIAMSMDDINKSIDEAYKNMYKLSKLDAPSTATATGRKNGGIIAKMREGGNVIKAQAGKFFPGFGGGDKIPILGEAGEYMINKFSVRSAGVDTAKAFNEGNWSKVVANLSKKMSTGGPTFPSFSGPAMAMAMGGGVPNNSFSSGSEAIRNYHVPGSNEPISVRADEKNAMAMLSALRRGYMNKRV